MRSKKSFFIFFLITFVISCGTIGFMIIEGWNFFDSLYMTVITLASIGYNEVHPLSRGGQTFNLFLILIGVGVVTYSVTAIITEIAAIDFKARRRVKMKKTIDLLSEHTIVCGFGRMGEAVCQRLFENKVPFVVIEKRQPLLEELKKLNYLFIEGDAANDDHLIDAGVERAKSMVSVLDNDSDSLYISLAARSLNKNLFIIARANEKNAKKRMLRAGANKVILPLLMSGLKVADTVLNPATEDLFDIADDSESEEDKRIQLADLFVTQGSPLNGSSLEDIGDQMKKLIIIGIKDSENHFVFKPSASHKYKEGDCLIAMGTKRDYEDAKVHLKLD